jgi:hypothetical protein
MPRRTIDRALSDLVAADVLTVKHTGRTTIYEPLDPLAIPSCFANMANQSCQSGESTEQELLEIDSKQAQPPESRMRAKTSESAADTRASRQKASRDPVLLGDPLAIFDVLMRLPEHLKPQQTSQVLDAITQALSRGWTPESLSDAIKAEITNPRAGAGLTVKVLLSLSQQPPQEHKQEQQQSPQRSSPRPEDRPDLSELTGTGTPELAARRAAEIRQSLAGAKRS